MKKLALVALLFLSGCQDSIWHEYAWLCRTRLEVPRPGGGFDAVYCQPDLACIAKAEHDGRAAQLRSEGYTLGCPEQ